MSWTRFKKSKLSARGLAVQSGPEETPVEVITEDQELQNVKKVTGEMDNRNFVDIFDDFLYGTMAETYTPWILREGTENAVAPAINVQTGGVARFVGGDGNGTIAQEASQMVCHIPMKLDDVGTAIVEARLKFVTSIDNGRLFVGFTDSTARAIAFSIGNDTVTSVANDAAGFLYDVGADAKTLHALSVSNNEDDSGNVDTTVAPKITYQTLRVEIDETSVKYYIDGELVATLTDEVPRKTVNLYATVCLSTDGTARSLDVDYIYVGHTRE